MSNEIAEKWLRAKEKLQAAQEELASVEHEALAQFTVIPTNYGTTSAGDLSIRCHERRVWDQEYLNDIFPEFTPEAWPFERTWKENKQALNELAEVDPTAHAMVMHGLVTKPAKPAFSHKALKK